jgi:hypothetical protein
MKNVEPNFILPHFITIFANSVFGLMGSSMKKVINQGLGPIRYNSIAYKLQVVYKIIL